ncbi:MAG TPA: hypothetical protein VFG00_11905, partial [Acidothermaceae bacterium]|nr:hypothetical protein [Acidothermaceae bacterium]
HSYEMLDTIVTVLLVQVQDNLDIGLAAEAMTAFDKVGAKLRAVVDFAIAHKDERLVFVHHRLRAAACQIDDGEAAMA